MRLTRPSLRAMRRLATMLSLGAFAMEAAALLLLVPNIALPSFVPLGFFGVASFVLGVTYPAVGWLIVSRSATNRIGWLLLLIGLSTAVDTFSFQYATYGLLGYPGALPFADVAAWTYFWGYFPALLLFFPAILLFPDGHVLSGRWRPLTWAVGIAALLILPAASIATWPFRGVALLAAQTPVEIYASNALLATLVTIGNMVLASVAIATVVGVVVRFRRSSGIERQQLKWFALAAVVTIVMLLAFSGGGIGAPFDGLAAIVQGAILPIGVGIAVLRYRLYDIDVVIRRTLVYVPLTALLAGIYAASIGISQRAFIAVVGKESDAAIVLSTLILAATFTPIKNAIQTRVDRTFRDANDVERRLLTFTQSVTDQLAVPDPGRTMRAFLVTAVGALKAGGGEAWFETPTGEESAGATEARADGPRLAVPVEVAARRFGRLELDARTGGGAYSARDLAALQTAAERLAVALHDLRSAVAIERAAFGELPGPMVDAPE